MVVMPTQKEMAKKHIMALTVVQDNVEAQVGHSTLSAKAARHARLAREALEQHLKTL